MKVTSLIGLTLATGLPALSLAVPAIRRELYISWIKAQDEFWNDGQWNLTAIRQYLHRCVGGRFSIQYLTAADVSYIYQRFEALSADISIQVCQSLHQTQEEEGQEGFDVEVGPAAAEGLPPVVRRTVRRGRRWHAAYEVYLRCVRSIGLKPYSSAQNLVLQDLAVREMREMNVRLCDMPDLLMRVSQLYFVPTEQQYHVGGLLRSERFMTERRLVDAPK